MFTKRHIFTKNSPIHNVSNLENTQMLISCRRGKPIVVWSYHNEKESTLHNMKEFHKNNFEGKEFFKKHLLCDQFCVKNKNRQKSSMLKKSGKVCKQWRVSNYDGIGRGSSLGAGKFPFLYLGSGYLYSAYALFCICIIPKQFFLKKNTSY